LQSHKRSNYSQASVARASGVFGAPQHKWRSAPNILQLHSFHELESWQCWLIDWLKICLHLWVIDWIQLILIDWFIGYYYWLICWLIDWLIDWLNWHLLIDLNWHLVTFVHLRLPSAQFTQFGSSQMIDWLLWGWFCGSPQLSPRPRSPK
jgi:hypothetical protein